MSNVAWVLHLIFSHVTGAAKKFINFVTKFLGGRGWWGWEVFRSFVRLGRGRGGSSVCLFLWFIDGWFVCKHFQNSNEDVTSRPIHIANKWWQAVLALCGLASVECQTRPVLQVWYSLECSKKLQSSLCRSYDLSVPNTSKAAWGRSSQIKWEKMQLWDDKCCRL